MENGDRVRAFSMDRTLRDTFMENTAAAGQFSLARLTATPKLSAAAS